MSPKETVSPKITQGLDYSKVTERPTSVSKELRIDSPDSNFFWHRMKVTAVTGQYRATYDPDAENVRRMRLLIKKRLDG